MPRAKKDHACLNIKIDAALYRKLMEVSEECSCAVKKHKNKTGTDSRPALFRKARA